MDATSTLRINTEYRALDNVFESEQDEDCSKIMNWMMGTLAKQVRSGGKYIFPAFIYSGFTKDQKELAMSAETIPDYVFTPQHFVVLALCGEGDKIEKAFDEACKNRPWGATPAAAGNDGRSSAATNRRKTLKDSLNIAGRRSM